MPSSPCTYALMMCWRLSAKYTRVRSSIDLNLEWDWRSTARQPEQMNLLDSIARGSKDEQHCKARLTRNLSVDDKRSPTTKPVITSHTPPFRSRSIRRLSAFDSGFSSSSWFACGSTEYAVSDVMGWAWVKTTVSACRRSQLKHLKSLWRLTCNNEVRSVVRILFLHIH